MMRGFLAHILSLLLALTSFVLADARGANQDVGMEIVICSGVGMTTISIGPDGRPIEKTEVCPDGTSIFTATFALPELVVPEARLIAFLAPAIGSARTPQREVSPAARGPPVPV